MMTRPDPIPVHDAHCEGSGTRRPSRRRYVPPRIVLRETIEAMAADCNIPGGKNDATCILGFS